jgi:hypothetical protein
MCRFVALAADRPAGLSPLLVCGPHALIRQSNCDRRGLPRQRLGPRVLRQRPARQVRSIRSAWDNSQFGHTAKVVRKRAAMAYVRFRLERTRPHGRRMPRVESTLRRSAGQSRRDPKEPPALRRIPRRAEARRLHGERTGAHAGRDVAGLGSRQTGFRPPDVALHQQPNRTAGLRGEGVRPRAAGQTGKRR